MSATVIKRTGLTEFGRAGSLRKERRWALITAYVSLVIAAIVMLAPPF